jgi:hypothetical protein
MRKFYKNHQTKTLEQYLVESIHEGTDYCLGFKEIPNKTFVKRFRHQFEAEFERLAQGAQLETDTKEVRPNLGRTIVLGKRPRPEG